MGQIGKRAMKRRSWEILFGIILLFFIIAALTGIGYHLMSRPHSLKQKNLCPADGPYGHFVLLVDKTDPLSFTQKQAFLVTLQEIIEKRTPKGYLLSVFVLDEDFKETAAPLEELCNPGTGSDKSEFTANLKRLRSQYEDKFLKPLSNQIDNLVTKKPAQFSPIFEMLQLVGINAFRKHDIKGERRLIIMSDMLHNTPQFSMYNNSLDFPSFAVSGYGRKTQSELRGVEVEIYYLINTPHFQTRRSLMFWEDYFNKAGAHIAEVRSLGG
jgi:hypothetical protein